MTWSALYLASEWIIRIGMLIYVPQRRSPSATRTWLLLIFFLPLAGLALYALFGRIRLPQKRIEGQVEASRRIREAMESLREDRPRAGASLPSHLQPLAALVGRLGDFDPFDGNAVELLPDYQGAIDRLVADIDGAGEHVHLLYYIFEDDACGRKVAAALARAAGRGVQCRVLMDAVGSSRGLRALAPALRAKGVEVHAALAAGPFRRNAARFDLRNHRKVAVIDGLAGHTGSQNIVDPGFIPGLPNVELVARVTGPAVWQLQALFLSDWYFETGSVPAAGAMFPRPMRGGDIPLQLLPSGPGFRRENAKELVVAMLYGARRRVVLVTPYFVPDEPVLLALGTAVRAGVTVDLVVSKRSNQRVTHLAQQSYYERLLEAGVRVHLFEAGHLHAKHFTCDGEIGAVGSVNLDIRSFALNAEVMMLGYGREFAGSLLAVQEGYIECGETLEPAAWARRPLSLKVAQNTARLADSLL